MKNPLDKKLSRGLGLRIDRIRMHAGLTQEKLAHLAGIDPTSLRDILAGRASPRYTTLYHIAEALGLDVRDILPEGRP